MIGSKMVVYDQTAYEKKAPAYTVHKRDMQTYNFDRAKSKLYDSVQIQYRIFLLYSIGNPLLLPCR